MENLRKQMIADAINNKHDCIRCENTYCLINIRMGKINQFFNTLKNGELELININKEQLAKSEYITFSYNKSGEIIGTSGVCIQRYIPIPYLFVVVNKHYWNQGIGTQLVKEAIKFAIKKYHVFFLSTLKDRSHENAIHMYKRCGFIHFPTPDKHYWMINLSINKYVKNTVDLVINKYIEIKNGGK